MRKWLPAVLIAATVIFSLALYRRLPDPMPIHWNAAGEIDGYGSRAFGTFLLPVIMLFVWGLLLILPALDPRSANIEEFRNAYDLMVITVIGVLCAIQVGLIASALGWPISVERIAPVAIGTLFVLAGRMLPRFRSNSIVGIKTPWTLSSETVWTRTHRVGGFAMVILGAFLILAGITRTGLWVLVAIGSGVAMMLFVLVYSYVLWRDERRSK